MAETKESITKKIAAKGNEIREVKGKGGDKAAITALVDGLKALKLQYADVTGEPYPEPTARAPREKKPKQPKEPKKPKEQKQQKPQAVAAAPAGGTKLTAETFLAELAKLGINVDGQMVTHDAVVTVEEMMEKAGSLSGGKAKNLFLKDKKGVLILVSALHDTPTPTKHIEKEKGLKNPRLASNDLLMEVLGLKPGAVSPLAAINDTEGKVKVILDHHFQARHGPQRHFPTGRSTLLRA